MIRWLEKENFSSFDWWDIWGTKYGAWSKGLYFKNKYAGAFFIAPIVALDFVYPSFRKFFVKKRTFPICHAHVALGYLNLYEVEGRKNYLAKAEKLIAPLLAMASPYTTGLGWGMKHEWMTIQGLIPANTACNTQTAYPYELFVRLHELTGKNEYSEYLEKILHHINKDFAEWKEGDKLVCSYSTIDKRRVINANSYRMYMLIEGGKRFKNSTYTEKGIATLKYILSKQNSDGSWPYSEDQSFVDCYHTVFVLKNLLKVKEILCLDVYGLDDAVQKGLHFYFKHLFYKTGLPKPFAKEPRITLFKYDSYDFSESIGLLSILREYDFLLDRSIRFVTHRFLTKEGWCRYRLFNFFPFKGIPYMRYANTNMFLNLTKAYKHYATANRNAAEVFERVTPPYPLS